MVLNQLYNSKYYNAVRKKETETIYFVLQLLTGIQCVDHNKLILARSI